MFSKLLLFCVFLCSLDGFTFAENEYLDFDPKLALNLAKNENNTKFLTPLFRGLVKKLGPALEAGYTTAQMNDFTDQILENIKHYIIEWGLDPMDLPDEKLSLFPGSLTLTKGYLEDTSTVGRYDDVIAKYSTDTKIFELTLPLTFEELVFTYKYHTQVLLIGITGQLDGKIKKARMTIRLGFNFNTYQAFVDKASVKDTGSISLSFEGHALTDWIIDLMSGVVTTLFHGLILDIVNLVIHDPIQMLIKIINEAIASVLHPNNSAMIF